MKVYRVNDKNILAASLKDAMRKYKSIKIKDYDFDFMRKARDLSGGDDFKIKKALKAIGRISKFGENITYQDLDVHLSNSDKVKFLKELIKIGDSIKDYKIVYAKDLNQGDILTMKEDNSKWRVDQVRKGPFGLTIRINSIDTPVKTKEITVSEYYGAMIDSIKDDITYDTRLKGAGSEVRNLCIKNNWYTEGDSSAYAKLLRGCDDGWTIAEISKDIAEHSRGVWTTDVAKELRRMVENKSYLAMKDSIRDEDIDDLSAEEQQAIDDYRKAIQGTSDPKLLALYAHILKEEVEHLDELQHAKESEFVEDDDSIKLGTRFTVNKTGNKEYIVTNTNLGGKGNDREFEYKELMINGNTRNPETMKYSEFKRRTDIHIL